MAPEPHDYSRRILLVDGSRGVTGALAGAANLAGALNGAADVVLVVDREASFDSEKVAMFSAVEKTSLCLPKRSLSAIMAYCPCLLLSALKLRLLLCRHRADAVIFNDFYFPQAMVLRLIGFTGPVVTWVRMDPRRYGRIGAVWLWLTRRASTHVVAVSRYISRLVDGTAATTVIYDPAPMIPPAQGTDPIDHDGPPTLVFIGNYIEGKGQDIALEAFAQALQAIPEARLEFYGGDLGHDRNREFLQRLKNRSSELGISDSVVFGDFVWPPWKMLSDKRAALNLSRSESFSMTVLEASAAGLAVIATRCGGPEEIVRNGDTGFLLDIDNVSACSAAMKQLCLDRQLAQEMGRNGRQWVMEKFSKASFRRDVLDLFKFQ